MPAVDPSDTPSRRPTAIGPLDSHRTHRAHTTTGAPVRWCRTMGAGLRVVPGRAPCSRADHSSRARSGRSTAGRTRRPHSHRARLAVTLVHSDVHTHSWCVWVVAHCGVHPAGVVRTTAAHSKCHLPLRPLWLPHRSTRANHLRSTSHPPRTCPPVSVWPADLLVSCPPSLDMSAHGQEGSTFSVDH